MTPSTEYLTAAQTAARLGIKPETLYAYVSRGLLPRHRASDGRTSLFALPDVTRLERRRSSRRGAPADITVASELTLVDKTDGRLWFRGLDALTVCRQRSFEEIAAWLWAGAFDRTPAWRGDKRNVTLAKRVQATLSRSTPPCVRLPAIAATLASTASGSDTPFGVMGALVDALPGPAVRSSRFTDRLARKLGAKSAALIEIDMLDHALALMCEHGLTHPTLAARLAVAAGGDLTHAVAAAMHVAAPSVVALGKIEAAFSVARDDGPARAADTLDAAAIEAAAWKEPYRSGDPRSAVIFELLRDVTPDAAVTVDALALELDRRAAPPPTAAFALAGLAWACGMPPGSAAGLSLVSRTVGWIAHALEEHRHPTPYRPRLAYTGPPPRAATPRRTLDAVQDYLAR